MNMRTSAAPAIFSRLGGVFFALLMGAFLIFSPAPGVAAEDKPQSEDKPYNIDGQGNIDWYSYNGFRRYHSTCHTCHGPAGLGSSFAPNLLESVKRLGYEKYLDIVVNGRVNVNTATQSTMPSFATDLNVMCFVDDIYAYLVARADEVLPPGRPAKKQAKPEEAKERDNACMG